MSPLEKSAAASMAAARNAGWFRVKWGDAQKARADAKQESALARAWPFITDDWQLRSEIIAAASAATAQSETSISNGLGNGLRRGLVEARSEGRAGTYYRRAPNAKLDKRRDRLK